jgi:hypothetical protein
MCLVQGSGANLAILNIRTLASYDGRQAGQRPFTARQAMDERVAPSADQRRE